MDLSRRQFCTGVAVVAAAPLLPELPKAEPFSGIILNRDGVVGILRDNPVFKLMSATGDAVFRGDLVAIGPTGEAIKAGPGDAPIGIAFDDAELDGTVRVRMA